MKMKRVLVGLDAFDAVARGDDLPKDAEHYFAQVLRLGAGDQVEVGDGSGRLLHGELAVSDHGLCVLNRCTETVPADQLPAVTVIAALLKQKRWQLLVEKVVELGADRLVPVITERTSVRPSPEKAQQAHERWLRLAREAGKQCKRPSVCRIEPLVSFPQALAEFESGTNLLLSLAAASPISSLMQTANNTTSFIVAIGPEGGFTAAEEALARRYAFQPTSLGLYPLRAETAAVVALGLIRNLV